MFASNQEEGLSCIAIVVGASAVHIRETYLGVAQVALILSAQQFVFTFESRCTQ